MMSGLLVCVGILNQPGLAPRPSDERNPDGQPVREAGRHGDAGIPGDCRRRGARAEEVIAIQEVGGPGRTRPWARRSRRGAAVS